jgi:hypothetical protein
VITAPPDIGSLLLCGFAPWMTPSRPRLPVPAHIARPDPFDGEDVFAAWEIEGDGIALELHRRGTPFS